ncbi:MAG: rhodanese-like domain-containing protein [Acidobacteriota bacterium]
MRTVAILLPLLLIFSSSVILAQESAERVSVDELKEKMERREKILIIDARAGKSLLGSQVQIRGAVHFTMSDLEKGTGDLPRDREIIIYCT